MPMSSQPASGVVPARRRKPTHLETLRIYDAFRMYRKYMYVAIDKMPRWIKLSEGMECIHSIKKCIRCLSVVARTYDRKIKLRYIDAFLTEWDALGDSTLFFFEVNGISKHQRDVMLNKREAIEEQVSAFRNWLASSQPELDGNSKDQSLPPDVGQVSPRGESSF